MWGLASPCQAILLASLMWLTACSVSEADRIAQARREIQKGDIATASTELRSLLQDSPGSGEARFLLGKTLFLAGDALAADVELRRALLASYSADEVTPLLAEVMVALHREDALQAEFGNVRLESPGAQAMLKLQLATAWLAKPALDEAQAALADALSAVPGFAPALLAQARLKLARGDRVGALKGVDELLERHKDDPAILVFKADLLAQAGASGRAPAVALYRQAIQLMPGQVQAHVGLMNMLLAGRDLDAARKHLSDMLAALPRHPQTWLFEAALALEAGDARRATELAQALLRVASKDPKVLVLAGQAAQASGALAQAEIHFQQALSLAPESPPPRRLLAELFLRTGQPLKALAVLGPLLGPNSDNTEALTLAGQAQLMAGDTAAASASFAAAARLNPKDLGARTGLALAKLRRGQLDAGIAELDAVAGAESGTAADGPLIDARLDRADFAGAMAAADRLAAKQPRLPMPDFVRGQIAAKAGKTEEARRHWQAALGKDAAFAPALAGLAQLDVASGKPQDALARYRAVVEANPLNGSALASLASLTAQLGGPQDEVVKLFKRAAAAQPNDAGPRVQLVDHALAVGDLNLALTAAQEASAALPHDPLILDALGRAQQANGNAQQALGAFSKAAETQPDAVAPLLRLVEAELAANDLDAARKHVKRALEPAPDQLPVQRSAILVALRAGQFDQALSVARDVQRRHPDSATGWQLEAEVEMAQKHPPAAVALLRKAQAKAASVDGAKLLHLALLGAGQAAEAKAVAQAWLRAHPDDLVFQQHLGMAALGSQDPAQAEQHFRQVLQRQPGSAMAMNNVAYAMALQKRPGASALAEAALKLAPGNPLMLDTLALCYAAEGKLQQAVQQLGRAVAIRPEDPGLRLNLARIQLQAGEKVQAHENLIKLAKYGPAFERQPEVARLQQALGSGPLRDSPSVSSKDGLASVRALGGSGDLFALVGAALAAIAGLGVPVALGLGALAPRKLRVERSVQIQATEASVFALLQDLQHWPRWSVWPQFGASAARRFGGAAEGQGAVCHWSLPGPASAGFIEVMVATPNSQLAVEVNHSRPTERRQLFSFMLTPEADGSTRVRMIAQGELRYLERVVGLFWRHGHRYGKPLEASLAALKAALERVPPEAAASAEGPADGAELHAA